jgi:hypothetical protein
MTETKTPFSVASYNDLTMYDLTEKQGQAMEAMLAGRSVILRGIGSCGKTTVKHMFHEHIRSSRWWRKLPVPEISVDSLEEADQIAQQRFARTEVFFKKVGDADGGGLSEIHGLAFIPEDAPNCMNADNQIADFIMFAASVWPKVCKWQYVAVDCQDRAHWWTECVVPDAVFVTLAE